MRRGATVAFAIVACLLIASAQPVSAANVSGSLEVASQNTTDSDFNAASTLTNVSVQNDNVTLSGTSVLDDFEDSSPLNDYGGDTGAFQTTGSPTYEGSTALQTIDQGQSNAYISDTDVTVSQGDTISVRVNLNSSSSDGGVVFATQQEAGSSSLDGYVIQNTGAPELRLRKLNGGSLGNDVASSGTISIPTDEWMEWEIAWANDGTMTVTVTNASGGQITQFSGQDQTYASGGIGFRSYDDIIEYDYYIKKGTTPPSGQYVGQNHSAENIEEMFFNVTLENASADLVAEYSTDNGATWQTANSTSVTTSANHTLLVGQPNATDWRANVTLINESGSPTTAKLHDEGVLFDASAPSGSNADPTGETRNYGGDVSLQVNDSDFALAQGDTVTVTLKNKTGGQLNQTTVNSNGTVTFGYSAMAGSNNLTWELTDSYGSSTTISQEFSTPNQLDIRNVSAPTTLINTATVDITFYGSNTTVQKSTSNGTINLDGLPADDRIIGVVEAPGYYNRHIIIENVFVQNSTYLLNDSRSAVEVRFKNGDNTGRFPEGESEVHIKRPLTRDFDGDGTNETQYATIAADEFGVAGYATFLEEGVRYRIAMRDSNSYQVVGPYTADISETVTLEPGDVRVSLNQSGQGFAALAYYEEYGGSHQRLTFEYADGANKTDQVNVTVYQQGNASNQLEPTQTISGPLGEASVNFNLTDTEANNTWVVNWTAERGAETVRGEIVAGKHVREQAIKLPGWVKEGSALAIIILTAALFSRVNRQTGAVTVALMGGGFWYAGWLPVEAGGAVVVALVAGVVYKVGLSQ